MQRAAYLERINFSHEARAEIEDLRDLQRAHLEAVPFENLDIALGRKIGLSERALWDKIVVRRRGGFCYELNGMFAWLLKDVGFSVTHLNARVNSSVDATLGIDFDHLALLVMSPDSSTRWLADVGFGDTFTQPLDIDNMGWQVQGRRAYRIEPHADGHQLWERNAAGVEAQQYFFDLRAREFPAEYESACVYQQTSPESTFTQKRIITRRTPQGRVSLSDNSLLITIDEQRTEMLVAEAERAAILKNYFDVVLEAG